MGCKPCCFDALLSALCCCWCCLLLARTHTLASFMAGLQYGRDITSWLSQTHVRYSAGVAGDLTRRIKQLHELVSMHPIVLKTGFGVSGFTCRPVC